MKLLPRSAFRIARLMRAGNSLPAGMVSLVGAGPGDPGLLTVKAARRLGEADVVFHDALVSEAILELCRPGTRLVDVGKRRNAHRSTQEAIVAALIEAARAGLAVVRLKGGDPFVFGRGGEEALALLDAGVPFEVVPGVTAGIAVPAAAGIPVTHRGLAGSAAFVTAHDLGATAAGRAGRARLRHLARGADTLVIFMAGAVLEQVRAALLRAGLPESTPAAVIESGTLPRQRAAVGTVGRLPELLPSRGEGPVLVAVGPTVALSETLRSVRAAASAASRIAPVRIEERKTRVG